MLRMIHGTFALLGWSLRINARAWTTHLCRWGLVAAIYVYLCCELSMQSRIGAPGLSFFQGIAYLDVAFMTLLGIGFFSTSISEEKEEDTLGLILMAGVSPWGILIGKSGGRLWQALLLIAVQYPLMLLAITMGGITGVQVWSFTLALVAYTVFLVGFGLLCSTLSPRNRTASGMMVVGITLYSIVPIIAWQISCSLTLRKSNGFAGYGPWNSFFQAVYSLSVLTRVNDILTSGFGDSPWSLQVISNSVVGMICGGLAWLLFGISTRHVQTESSTRGFVSVQGTRFRFPAGRPWSNPFFWKDFHFVSGGMGMMLVRACFYFALILGVRQYFAISSPGIAVSPNDSLLQFLLSFLVAIDAGLVLSRSLHDEVRGQTLSSILMLPRSSIATVYSKFAGALFGWLPGPLIVLAFTMSSPTGRSNFASLMSNQAGGWCLILLFLLIPHFSAMAALFVRWGAVPVGIGLTIAVYMGIILSLLAGRGLGIIGDETACLAFWSFVLMLICAACHLGILLRFQALGER